MEATHEEVRSRTLRGIRWVMILSLSTTPLSFVTSMILGWTSAETLGYYGAVQIFVGTFTTFLVLGGAQVFTRFVPALERRQKFPFLVSYTLLVLGLVAGILLVGLFLPRPWLASILERFGNPAATTLVLFSVAVTILAFTGHFLFGMLEGRRAALSQRFVVLGYFVAAVLGLGPLRESLVADPARYLWTASLAIYGGAATLGVLQIFRIVELRGSRVFRWYLPDGFWSVVFLAHASTLVIYTYDMLAPTCVLLWLDVTRLGFLQPALRYRVFMKLVPALLAAVVAPALSSLDAAGRRDVAFRQTAAAINATLVLLTPTCLVLIFFAGDAMAIFGPEFREHRDLLRVLAISFLAGPVVLMGAGLLTALGAFRSYLAASLIYVVFALILTLALIPMLGLTGAVLASTLGAFLQQAALAVAMKLRFGFALPRRVYVAWALGSFASVMAVRFDPDRLAAAAMFLAFMFLFVWIGRVTSVEVRRLAKLAAGRKSTSLRGPNSGDVP